MLLLGRVSYEISPFYTEIECDELKMIFSAGQGGLACLALATQLAQEEANVDVGYWHASVSSLEKNASEFILMALHW